MIPTFSIVTPSYNQGKFIEQTIRSVLSQDGEFFIDYVIIDGGSTDETLSIIHNYDRILNQKQWPVRCAGITFRFYSEPDRGQCHAINKGFDISQGDILSWLNSDDYYAPGALKIVADYYKSYPDAGAFVGDGEMRDESGKQVFYAPSFEVNAVTLGGWINRYFYQPSCFFTRDAWNKSGPLLEWLEFAMDLDLWMKISRLYQFVPISAMLSTSQKHDNAKTTAFWYLATMEVALVIASYGGAEVARSDYAAFLEAKEMERNRDLNAILSSRSWKVTYPLRLILKMVRNIMRYCGATNF